jgi:hypothetical protein
MTAFQEQTEGLATAHERPKAETGVTARAVALLYVYRAVTGFVFGYPVARTLGALGASALPDGDREFFAPGGLHLLEALRLGVRILPSALESATFAGILVSIAGTFPFAVALTDVLNPSWTRRERFGRAAERAPTLLVLTGATVLVQALVLTFTVMIATGAGSLAGSLRNERTSDLPPLVVGAVGLLLCFAIGVVQDLARAAAVRHATGALESVRVAARTLSSAPGAVCRAFVTPALAAIALVTGGAAFASVVDVSRPGAWRVAAVGLEHQLVILAIVVLRLGALARALTLTGPHGREKDPCDDPDLPNPAEDIPPGDALTE